MRSPLPLTVLDRRTAFRQALDAERAAGRTVGVVPTMGALHRGHLSLLARAAGECDVVAATVYVNPLQFGPSEDLAAYPRDLEGDAAALRAAGAGYLFAPDQEEMFPEPPATTVAVTGTLGEALEGASRPGHLRGVATIVTKLLSLAGACRAYFGEKDYQQLAVVRRLVADLSLPVHVVGCPIVRDPDGLALSSRNARLSPAERAVAPALYQALRAGAEAACRPDATPAAVEAAMRATLQEPGIAPDYAVAADAVDLSPLAAFDRPARLLVAARIGRTRLIDNLAVPR